jgi:hypothetical protein
MCRRASGALFVSWATVDRSAFAWKTDEPSYFRSSRHARRSFCSKCGTSLTWESYADGRLTESIDLAIGSLDDPNAVSPTEHIWAAEQVGCLRFADGLPRRAGDTKSDSLAAF